MVVVRGSSVADATKSCYSHEHVIPNSDLILSRPLWATFNLVLEDRGEYRMHLRLSILLILTYISLV